MLLQERDEREGSDRRRPLTGRGAREGEAHPQRPGGGRLNIDGKQVVVWLHDEAARLLLGLGKSGDVSRWAMFGKVASATNEPVGLWVGWSHSRRFRVLATPASLSAHGMFFRPSS